MLMEKNTGSAPKTLPGNFYFDPDQYDREKEKIFYRSWQYVGHVSMLDKPSTYLVREIAEESIIVIRSHDGELRAFYNVCQHRAHRLLEGEGQLGPGITCPYHTWTYNHCGALVSARGTKDIVDFDKSLINLKSIKLELLCGFIFINMDENAQSMANTMAGLEEELRQFSPVPEKLKVSNRYDLRLEANWKNSIENYSECYHCPNKHPTLIKNALDLESYKIECKENYHVHRSRDKGDEVGYQIDADSAMRPNEFRSFYIWPNTVLEVYPGGNLTVFHHAPQGPEKTIQGIEWYFTNHQLTADDQAVVDFVHSVRLEDVPLCESVQKGLHSQGYGQGQLVVDPEFTSVSEHAVHHFQCKVARATADSQ